MGKINIKIRYIIVFTLIVLPLLAGVFIKIPISNDGYILPAIKIYYLNLFPIFLFLFGREKYQSILMVLVSAFNIVAYSLPVYFVDINDYQLTALSLEAMEVVFYAQLFFISFFLLGIKFIRKRKFDWKISDDNYKGIKKIMVIFLFIIIVYELLNLNFLVQLVLPLKLLYGGLFIYLIVNKKINKSEIIIFGLFLLFELFLRTASGLIAQTSKYFLFLGITYFYISKKLPFFWITIAMIFIFILNPVKHMYRSLVWGEDRYSGLTEKVELFFRLGMDYIKQENEFDPLFYEKDEQNFFWRFSYSGSALSLVIENTPSVIGYWKGQTYLPVFTKLIPRFLYPDKPVEDVGQQFGHRYNILDPDDYVTSMNLPIIAEGYANFGYIGMIIVMALIGIIYSLVEIFLNFGQQLVGKIISTSIWFPIITQESSFTLLIGSIPLQIISIYFICKYVSLNSKPGSEQ